MRIKDLYKKHPFIYELDGEYFYLGQGICRKCGSQRAISYYEKFKECIDAIGEKNIDPYECDKKGDEVFDNLILNFKKTYKSCKFVSTEKDISAATKKLDDFLSQLNPHETAEIERQLGIFTSVFVAVGAANREREV